MYFMCDSIGIHKTLRTEYFHPRRCYTSYPKIITTTALACEHNPRDGTFAQAKALSWVN